LWIRIAAWSRCHVGADPVPATAWANAVYASYTPEESRTDEQQAAVAHAATLTDELIAADALLFAVPLYNFGVSQHFKAWVDMVITDPRMAAGTQPILAGKPAVLVTVRGGNYRVGTPREGWDHATGWMRRILADVWHLDLKVVQAESRWWVSIPHWTSSPISPASCARRPKRRRAATAASLAPRSPLPPRRPREACARLSARPDPMGEKLLSCGAGGSWWWLGGGRS